LEKFHFSNLGFVLFGHKAGRNSAEQTLFVCGTRTIPKKGMVIKMKNRLKQLLASSLIFVLLAVSFTFISSAKAEKSMPDISVSGQQFVDEHGRVRVFHGLNYTIGKHGRTADILDDEFFAICAAKGFNVLRLGVTWLELEPEPDVYNEDLLTALDAVFDAAENHGVYLFLEIHQDLYGRAAAGYGGVGAPDWACLTDGVKVPQKMRFVWAEGYFWGKSVHRAFDNFWNNAPAHGKGLQDHFAELWAMLSARYAGKPAFLGYDFLNEPYPGKEGGKVFRSLIVRVIPVMLTHPIKLGKLVFSAIRGESLHLLDFLDGKVMRQVTKAGDKRIKRFDEEKYAPFFEKMTNAVRSAEEAESAPERIAFMANSYYSNLGIPYSASRPSVNGRPDKNTAFAPHGYDLVVDTDMYDNPGDNRVIAIFEEHRRSQQRLDMPVLVGEWGGEWGGKRWIKHCETLLDLFDSYGWSNAFHAWIRWESFEFRDYDFLTRPYPMAINGADASYAFDKEAGTFTLTYTQPAGADPSMPTIIYLPAEATVTADGLTAEFVPLDSEHRPGAGYLYLTGKTGKHSVTVNF